MFQTKREKKQHNKREREREREKRENFLSVVPFYMHIALISLQFFSSFSVFTP